MTDTIELGRWYPCPPPSLDGETDDTYSNRLLGILPGRPYDHPRNRQCSLGYHGECSDPVGDVCRCPHHSEPDSVDAGGIDMSDVNEEAAVRLADLYYLPYVTGYRVMHHAEHVIQVGEVTTLEQLKATLGELYGSTITDGFAIDVANLLGHGDLVERQA